MPIQQAAERLLEAVRFNEDHPESADGSMSLDAAWDDLERLDKELAQLRAAKG